MISVQAQAVSGWGRPRQRRILLAAYATGLHGQTRDCSPRQLPTNHDHDGEPCARSTNIRVINRRHALPRLLFTCAWARIKRGPPDVSSFDRSFHIRLREKRSLFFTPPVTPFTAETPVLSEGLLCCSRQDADGDFLDVGLGLLQLGDELV